MSAKCGNPPTANSSLERIGGRRAGRRAGDSFHIQRLARSLNGSTEEDKRWDPCVPHVLLCLCVDDRSLATAPVLPALARFITAFVRSPAVVIN